MTDITRGGQGPHLRQKHVRQSINTDDSNFHPQRCVCSFAHLWDAKYFCAILLPKASLCGGGSGAHSAWSAPNHGSDGLPLQRTLDGLVKRAIPAAVQPFIHLAPVCPTPKVGGVLAGGFGRWTPSLRGRRSSGQIRATGVPNEVRLTRKQLRPMADFGPPGGEGMGGFWTGKRPGVRTEYEQTK